MGTLSQNCFHRVDVRFDKYIYSYITEDFSKSPKMDEKERGGSTKDKKNSKNPKAKPQLANIDGMDKTEIAFRLADKDKSGYITKSEFEKMAKNLSKEQIEKVFAKCDKDGDGKINFSEFSSMMAMAKK